MKKILLFLFGLIAIVGAAQNTWNAADSATNVNWSNNGNWSLGTKPGVSDTVTLDATGGSKTPTVDENISVKKIIVTSGFTRNLSFTGKTVTTDFDQLYNGTGTLHMGNKMRVGDTLLLGAGVGAVVSVNAKPVLVVNTKTGGLKAFSAICPHLGCVASWDDKKSVIHCPCHEGIFNATTGEVVSGPPPRGLAAYELAVKDGKIMIGKPLGQLYGS